MSLYELSECKIILNTITELPEQPLYVGEINPNSGYDNYVNQEKFKVKKKEVIDFIHIFKVLNTSNEIIQYAHYQLEQILQKNMEGNLALIDFSLADLMMFD